MRLTREFEPGWRGRGRIDIFGKCDYLKGAAEHFGMQQRLERAFGFGRVGYGRLIPTAKFGDDAGKEMMLIGESRHAQAICLRATGDACPIDLHRNVCVTDLFKG